MNRLGFTAVVLLQNRHQPPRFDIVVNVKIRQPGDTQASQCRTAHALAIAEQNVAFGFDLDPLAISAAKHPRLGMAVKTEAETVVTMQLVKGPGLAASSDVSRCCHRDHAAFTQASLHQAGLFHGTGADRHIGTAFQQVHDGIGQLYVEGDVGIRREKTRYQWQQAMQTERQVGVDLNQPAGLGHVGDIALGRVNQFKNPQALTVEPFAFSGEFQASGRTMQQTCPQANFHAGNQFADGRRRHVQLPCGFGKGAGVDHSGEHFHLAGAVDVFDV
ncbi:hypothetical protein D3C87_1091900 [compost metagenome]